MKNKKAKGEKTVNFPLSENIGKEDAVNDLMPVTRGELKDLLGQITENMNQLSGYLMEDVNALFRNYVYPSTLRERAVLELLVEKGLLVEAEVDARVHKIQKDAIEKAKQEKQVVSDSNGEVVSDPNKEVSEDLNKE